MEQLKRKESKIIMEDGTESVLQNFIDCRDGIIDKVSFRDMSGYGDFYNAYLCTNSKHETNALIIHRMSETKKDVVEKEETICFDSDSWECIEKLFRGEGLTVRSYIEE